MKYDSWNIQRCTRSFIFSFVLAFIEELTKVPEKKSLLGEPTGHMIVTSPPTIDYDLEEGEIHPSEDTGIIVNGNCEESE